MPETAGLNILYIGNDLKDRGGLPNGMHYLGEALEKEGVEVLKASHFRPQFLRLGHMLLRIWKHRKELDFVLIDTYSTRNFWYAYLTARICQRLCIRYIPVLRGGDLPRRLREWPRESRVIFGGSFVNVAPSPYLYERFSSHGFRNLRYIPNHLSIEKYAFKERGRLRPKLLWVRAFHEIYNPLMALKVLELLLETYPEAELCMVGPDKDASGEHCRSYAREHGLPVRFPGKLEKEEWIRLSSTYDIFINSSQVDNTPVSLMEAMALGLCVVSTDVGGVPYLVEDQEQGVLVPADSARSMAEAITGLVQRPEKARSLIRSGRKRVEGFDWAVVRQEWEQVLEW